MSRTITAFFDSRSEAEAARTRLTQSSIDADNVRIVDKSSSERGDSNEHGFWASVKDALMPAEDSHAYEEGMRRGGFLLCAQVDEDRADEAVSILEQTNSVDFDSRQKEWRQDGWAGYQAGSTGREQDRAVSEERIPLVEEELKVGKREVARGGAKVRSYVREVPVHEEVSLREEHVSVERRPVDQKLGRAELERGDVFGERTVEMTETAEEAVVAKEARVREELVVRKTAEERVEHIDDTVRRTEVDVDRGEGGSSAFGFDKNSGTASGRTQTGERDKERESGFLDNDNGGYSPRIDKSGL